MTVSLADIRIKIDRKSIHSYVSKKGIDAVFKPYDLAQNIYDLRLQTSDKNPVVSERCFKEDVNKEIEKFKIISDRMRDSPLYVKSFDKRKVGFTFETDNYNKSLDSIDEVRKNAKNILPEMPLAQNQIRWADIS